MEKRGGSTLPPGIKKRIKKDAFGVPVVNKSTGQQVFQFFDERTGKLVKKPEGFVVKNKTPRTLNPTPQVVPDSVKKAADAAVRNVKRAERKRPPPPVAVEERPQTLSAREREFIKAQNPSQEDILDKLRRGEAKRIAALEVDKKAFVAAHKGKSRLPVSQVVRDPDGKTVFRTNVTVTEEGVTKFRPSKHPLSVFIDPLTGGKMSSAEAEQRRKEVRREEFTPAQIKRQRSVVRFKRLFRLALRSLSPQELVKGRTASNKIFVDVANEVKAGFTKTLKPPPGADAKTLALFNRKKAARSRRLKSIAKFAPLKIGIIAAGLGVTKIASNLLPESLKPTVGRSGKVTPGTIVADRVGAVKVLNNKTLVNKKTRDAAGKKLDRSLGIKTEPGRPLKRFKKLRKRIKKLFKRKRLRGPQTTLARQKAAKKAWTTRRRLYGRDGVRG